MSQQSTKFETQPVLHKVSAKTKTDRQSSSARAQETSASQIIANIRQKKILFVRENIQTQENFMIQIEDQQEVIYLKPEQTDAVMIELTRIAISEDGSEIQQIEYHHRAASLLDYYTTNQIQVQYTTVLYSKINYAIALKRYALSDETLSLLMESDQILKIKGKSHKKSAQAQPNEPLWLAKVVQNKLLRLRIQFQCTLLFSESRRNKSALDLAKGSLKMLRSIFQNTIKLCQVMNIMTVVNKKQRANSEMSSPQQQLPQQKKLSYVQIVEATFKEVFNLIKCVMPPTISYEDRYNENLIMRSHQGRSQSLDKFSEAIFYNQPNQINKLYPMLDDNHPMLQLQILGLMQLNSVDIEELYPINNCDMVIAEEVVLELIMLTGLCFYSISTEMRFINQSQSQVQHFDNRQTLEIWLCKSLEVYYTFIPHGSMIFNQIYQVYKKLYGVDKQMIPEDSEITHTTKLLRPHPFNNKATLANKLVIVIKVPQGQIPSMSKHAQTTAKTNPTSNKHSKKYLMPPSKHLLTQVDSEDQEDTNRSPTKLFTKPLPKPQAPSDIRSRVESLMSQILTSQVKFQQDKSRNSILKNNSQLKQKYNIYMSKQSAPNIVQQPDPEPQPTPAPVNKQENQIPRQLILARSLSNSRKNSQGAVGAILGNVQLQQQPQQQTRTSLSKQRYKQQMNTLPIEGSCQDRTQLFQNHAASLISMNRNTNKKYLVMKPSHIKQRLSFQITMNNRASLNG